MKQNKTTNCQIKSKERVHDHAEVFTNKEEVINMLNLVDHEFDKIDSTFMEPSCGTGNFLQEILIRKLKLVSKMYKSNQFEWEINAIKALSSIYGIELLSDNVKECRDGLFKIFHKTYTSCFQEEKEDVLKTALFILKNNIINGDSLTLHAVIDNKQTDEPIKICEWIFLLNKCKRKVFSYENVIKINNFKKSVTNSKDPQMSIFSYEDILNNINPDLIMETNFTDFKNIWKE